MALDKYLVVWYTPVTSLKYLKFAHLPIGFIFCPTWEAGRAMKLMTKKLEARFRKIGSQEYVKDPIVVAKFFNPMGSGTWYATEFGPRDRMFFGFVSIFGTKGDDEWGYFSLDELESIKLPGGLGIEQDLHCGEVPISEHEIKTLTI